MRYGSTHCVRIIGSLTLTNQALRANRLPSVAKRFASLTNRLPSVANWLNYKQIIGYNIRIIIECRNILISLFTKFERVPPLERAIMIVWLSGER